jgi:hypothetical protein
MVRRARYPFALTVALVCVLFVSFGAAQAEFTIGLNETRSGIIPTLEVDHTYILNLPAGVGRLTVYVDGSGDDADLAVYFGSDGEELCYDISLDPNPTCTVDNPRAGRYTIEVMNLIWKPLRYTLRVTGDAGSALPVPPLVPVRVGVSASPATVEPGASVAAHFDGAPGAARDWVGLYRVGANDREFVAWQYTNGLASGTLTFVAPPEPGEYEFRIFPDDSYTVLASSLPFTVRRGAGPGGGSAPRLTLVVSSVAPEATLTVGFDGAPANAQDWIALYAVGAGDREYFAWQYTGGVRSGSLSFRAPSEPGSYEFRLFENNAYTLLATSAPFRVALASVPPVGAVPLTCTMNLRIPALINLAHGAQAVVTCPAGCTSSQSVWGTGVYTDDSSICRAAIHAGLISVDRGGTVTVIARPGRSSYQGSTANGVTTSNYGSWSRSFEFLLTTAVPPLDANVLQGTFTIIANGVRSTVTFTSGPAGWSGTYGGEALSDITFDGRNLRFVRPISGHTQTYSGALSQSTPSPRFEGTFTQISVPGQQYSWSMER